MGTSTVDNEIVANRPLGDFDVIDVNNNDINGFFNDHPLHAIIDIIQCFYIGLVSFGLACSIATI